MRFLMHLAANIATAKVIDLHKLISAKFLEDGVFEST